MRSAVPDRDRWLALGLLGLVLALGYLLLVHPWWTRPMIQLDDRVETLQQRDLRARMTVSQQPQVQERLQAQRELDARRPGFMPEGSPERAAAALVQRLETTVAEASPGNRGCAIINRSPMTDMHQQPYPRAIVQVRLRCGGPELAAVLHALESGSPRLFVDNLNILAQQQPGVTGQPAQGVGLDVSFDLIGTLRPASGGVRAD